MENERKQMLEVLHVMEAQGWNWNDVQAKKQLYRKTTIFKKCEDTSIFYREKGNDVFRLCDHNAKIHMKIWKYYCYSIATAPTGSDLLALGYANRSALLLHLKKYEDCIKDIDRALKITKSYELKVKLFCRKTECLVALQDGKQKSAFEQAKYWFSKIKKSKDMKLFIRNLEKVKNILETNEKDYNVKKKKIIDIECKNDAIIVNHNQKYGRHLLAARYIEPGEFVCMDEFYVTSVYANKNFAFCSHCLARSWTTIPCDDCAYCMYCSEKCKERSWELYHDIECSMNLAAYVFLDNIVQLSIRSLIMGYKEAGNLELLQKMVDNILNFGDEKTKDFLANGKRNNHNFKSLISLSYQKNFVCDTYKATAAVQALMRLCSNKSQNGKEFVNDKSKKFVDQKNMIFLSSLLLRLVSIFRMNSVMVNNSYEQNESKSHFTRGIAYFPIPSLINHSCNNNVGRFFTNDGKVVYFSNQPIKKGAQIFTSYYVSYLTNSIERKSLLSRMFEFDCDCAACKYNWPSYSLVVPETFLNDVTRCSSRKLIKSCAKGLENKIKNNNNSKNNKPCEDIQLHIIVLSRLIENRYGFKLTIPDQCNFERKKFPSTM